MNAKLKCFCIGFVSFAVFMTANGCSGVFTDRQTVYTEEERAYARSQLDAAHEEAMTLFDNLPKTRSEDSEEVSEAEMEVMSAAWMATYTGDYDSFIQVLKDYGIYKDVKRICKKYRVEKQNLILDSYYPNSRASASDYLSNPSLRDGDIFFTGDHINGTKNASSGSVLSPFIPGQWKHVGMFDSSARNSAYPIFSASNFTDTYESNKNWVIGRVGYDNREKWATRQKIQIRRVRNSNSAQGTAALNYAKQFYGCKFDFGTNREKNDKWYCSKLVYRAWLSQGYNLEADAGKNQKIHVTPQDLHDDPDTYYLMGDLD